MAIKVLRDGTVVIKTPKQLKEVLQNFNELQAEIQQLRKESGLEDLENDAVAMKASATNYMIEQDMERIDVGDSHFTLIKGTYDARFVGTDEDMKEGDPDGVIPLRRIIYKKFAKDRDKAKAVWFRVSKRQVVKDLLEEVVSEGVLTVDEISPSFVEKQKKPYLRKFDG